MAALPMPTCACSAGETFPSAECSPSAREVGTRLRATGHKTHHAVIRSSESNECTKNVTRPVSPSASFCAREFAELADLPAEMQFRGLVRYQQIVIGSIRSARSASIMAAACPPTADLISSRLRARPADSAVRPAGAPWMLPTGARSYGPHIRGGPQGGRSAQGPVGALPFFHAVA